MPPTFRMTKWDWLALVSSVALLVAIATFPACSRPPPPHPETVAPAADDEPTVCHGPDCAVPGVK